MGEQKAKQSLKISYSNTADKISGDRRHEPLKTIIRPPVAQLMMTLPADDVEEENESWSVLEYSNEAEAATSSALTISPVDVDKAHEWPSLPQKDMVGIGIEAKQVNGDEEIEDDWDVLSTTSSVWTAHTAMIDDKKSYSDVVSAGYGPLLSIRAKVVYPPLFMDPSAKSKSKNIVLGKIDEEPDDICFTTWEGYKYSRGGKVNRWFKGR
mmetsp:Transcript_123364/g.184491  ORF Transcript_123364/g.184491 Transcript_123364/m.184491 type:complete len:210 (-) Transcript_123364:2183-2812(-)